MNRALWLVGLLLVADVGSAMGVIYAKYRSRAQFVVLEELRARREWLDVEWGRLRLEEGTLSTHSRIEPRARRRLQMRPPGVDEVIVVRH